MRRLRKTSYAKVDVSAWPIPNYWDMVALILVLGLIVTAGWGLKSMLGSFQVGEQLPISLSITHLPYYALRTVLRMFVALVFSLLFTLLFGAWAAKSRRAERIIIPMVDILQSVPVLGFLSISVLFFMALFPGSLLGPEFAAIFAIFTSQVWNMLLSFYQSLKTVPNDLVEAANVFQLSSWQRFWRVEVPFAIPGLLWNAMMSMSSSWVFLVAAEAFPVFDHPVTLPGIGSYIALAIAHADKQAITWVIITMFVVIAIYDQLLFRPLVAWTEKFKAAVSASEEEPQSWVLDLFQRTHWFRRLGERLSQLGDYVVNFRCRRHSVRTLHTAPARFRRLINIICYAILLLLFVVSLYFLSRFMLQAVNLVEVGHVVYLGFATALRVMVLLLISSLIWVPVGVWIGLHPRATQWVQPIVQFLAAFPAYLLFPVVVSAIVTYHLNVNIWVSPLMILGTQWYILFNVIAGTVALPKNLHQAVGTLNVRGHLWWRRFVLPGIFPYYLTGVITAAGGAWNISIVAEAVSWGHTKLDAIGLGAYIANMYAANDYPKMVLGIVVMSLWVLAINRFIWRPLYRLAEQRYHIV